MRLSYIQKWLLLFLMGVFVSSCTVLDHSGAKPLPDLTFSHLNPFIVKGGATRITQTFTPDEMTRIVSGEFVESPAFMLRRYANKRFVIEGQNALPTTFVFNIQKASLSKNTSNTDPLNFMIGLSQDTYKLVVFLELAQVQPNGQQSAPHTIFYEQDLIVSSNVSLEEREIAQFKFYERMITDIDRAVSDIVLNKLH